MWRPIGPPWNAKGIARRSNEGNSRSARSKTMPRQLSLTGHHSRSPKSGSSTAIFKSLAARKATFLLSFHLDRFTGCRIAPHAGRALPDCTIPAAMRTRSPFFRCLVIMPTSSPRSATPRRASSNNFVAKTAARCFSVTVGLAAAVGFYFF